jgi:small subunit ribosomal protein S2
LAIAFKECKQIIEKMARTTFEELLDAGVHFGHLKRKWNPNMAPYIFMERSGIHIIDLYKTMAKLEEAASAIKQVARSGKKILFVATKKQAKEIVSEHVKRVNMPYVTERWPGGMLTNFATIRKAVRKMASIDKMMNQDNYKNLSKRERLQITRERAKLEKQLGSISDLNRLPSAIFVVDILKEKIAVAEARKLNIPVFAMVDTNSDPLLIDFPIPANDDASKSINLITRLMVDAIEEGLAERKVEKDRKDQEEAEEAAAEEEKAEKAAAEEYADLEDEEADKLVKEGSSKQPAKPADESSAPKKREGGKRPRKPVSKQKK